MTALEKSLGEAVNKLFTAEPQKEPKFEVDKNVYKICYFGTPKTGYDIQIIEYRIKYLGKNKFLPYGFENMAHPELEFYSCLNYFMANRYQKEGKLYLGQDKRISYIEEE